MSHLNNYNQAENSVLKDLSYIAIFGILFFLLLIWIVEARKSYQEREYHKFLTIFDNYNEVVTEKNNTYNKMYDHWAKEPNLRAQKLRECNSLYYLIWRLNSQDSLVNIEYELLVNEVRCISYMNKLCEIALHNKSASEVMRLREAYELFFYNTHFNDVQKFYNNYREKLKLENLDQSNIRNVFEGNIVNKPLHLRIWREIFSLD
jgi:hypothetical protein